MPATHKKCLQPNGHFGTELQHFFHACRLLKSYDNHMFVSRVLQLWQAQQAILADWEAFFAARQAEK